jgi:hypothetical protein
MFTLLVSAGLIAGSGSATIDQDVYASRLATPQSQATIVQSGPAGRKPVVRKKMGPGYQILEQSTGGNHAIIIQQDQGGE